MVNWNQHTKKTLTFPLWQHSTRQRRVRRLLMRVKALRCVSMMVKARRRREGVQGAQYTLPSVILFCLRLTKYH